MGTPLGDFLRQKRDAVRPEDLGFPTGPRRRVPGLRRAELASAAGISVEYLVRLEQGRDRHPSIPILTALADVLRLDPGERDHLFRLMTMAGGACRGDRQPLRDDVRPTVIAVLDALEPGIALVTNRAGDVLARTTGFDLLAEGVGVLEAPRPNLTLWVFTDPRAREVLPDWDRVADERVFDLWLGPSKERSAAMRDELLRVAGDAVGPRLGRATPPPRTVLRWRHAAGELRFDRETLELPADDAQQLVVFVPADAATAEAVAGLRRTAAPLRAVR